jgi:hypothetical protein
MHRRGGLPRMLSLVLLTLCALSIAAVAPRPLLAYPHDWERTVAAEAHFDVDSDGVLFVEVPDADVVLQPGPPGRLDIKIEVASNDLDRALERYKDMEFSMEANDNRVTIDADAPRSRWQWRRNPYLVTVRVTLPEDFNVDIKTEDGNIDVVSLRGHLHLHTTDGDIHIGKANSPRVHVDTSDGDITLGEIRAPDVQIETADGYIEAAGLWGRDIDIRTGDGDINIEALSGGLNAITSDGDIRVKIDDLAPTTLRSGDGNITILTGVALNANVDLLAEELFIHQADLNFQGSLSKHRARGKLNGGGPRLQVSTQDGSIRLSTRD